MVELNYRRNRYETIYKREVTKVKKLLRILMILGSLVGICGSVRW